MFLREARERAPDVLASCASWQRYAEDINNERPWICADTSMKVAGPDQLKVFANDEAASNWLRAYRRDGMVYLYKVIEE
ncbi:hypothetical protein CWS35_15935 [Bradyrhizobium sp. SK17]|nr:hypothetical protein CWS35_15935 [Bradyrhizobium sp. SK17]